MSKHTPGPWKAKGEDGKYDNRRNSWSVCDDSADCCESAPITLGDGTVVAFAVASDNGYFSEDRTEANAALIASAPELLDVAIRARRLLWEICEETSHPLPLTWVDAADAAIAKATGEPE